jgi:hypothetical protein
MIEALANTVEQLPQRVLTDSGYRSEQNFTEVDKRVWSRWWLWGAKATIGCPSFLAVSSSARMAERLASRRVKPTIGVAKSLSNPFFRWIKH